MFELIVPVLGVSTGWVLSLGFLLGLKHATEADHLAAVSTIVADRKSLFSSAVVGGLWGLGHTVSLVIAGVFVLLLNFQISEQTENWLEFGVGVMLVLLGLNVLKKLLQGGHLHFHSHEHGSRTHTHPHLHEADENPVPNSHHGFSFNSRAVLIGMVHGLAGSAALMLMVIPTIDSQWMGLLYIVVFGIGSIGGMMLMSFIVGLPFKLTAAKFDKFNVILQCLAGMASVGIGLKIVYEKGFL
jgi:ABC-type nickel/cobalt efflux system permease component RcnA